MRKQLNVESLLLKIGQSMNVTIFVPNFWKNYGSVCFLTILLYLPCSEQVTLTTGIIIYYYHV